MLKQSNSPQQTKGLTTQSFLNVGKFACEDLHCQQNSWLKYVNCSLLFILQFPVPSPLPVKHTLKQNHIQILSVSKALARSSTIPPHSSVQLWTGSPKYSSLMPPFTIRMRTPWRSDWFLAWGRTEVSAHAMKYTSDQKDITSLCRGHGSQLEGDKLHL